MQVERVDLLDCTNRSLREEGSFVFDNDMVIIATPVYYGRIPEEVVPFLKSLSTQNKPVALVVWCEFIEHYHAAEDKPNYTEKKVRLFGFSLLITCLR